MVSLAKLTIPAVLVFSAMPLITPLPPQIAFGQGASGLEVAVEGLSLSAWFIVVPAL